MVMCLAFSIRKIFQTIVYYNQVDLSVQVTKVPLCLGQSQHQEIFVTVISYLIWTCADTTDLMDHYMFWKTFDSRTSNHSFIVKWNNDVSGTFHIPTHEGYEQIPVEDIDMLVLMAMLRIQSIL